MRILLDLTPVLPRGGGLQNALNLWRAAGEHGSDHAWLAVARPGLGLGEVGAAPHQELLEVEAGGTLRRLGLSAARIPSLARRWEADVVFTPMGAGPLRSPVPVVMGWHDSTLAYPGLRLDPGSPPARALRSAWARAAARRASRVCVQTRTMARRLGAVWGLPASRFHVVPNGPSAFLEGEPPAPAQPPAGGPRRILAIGEPKPAKNLDVVPAVAAALRRRDVRDVEVVLTVSPDPGPWTGPLEEALAAHPDRVPVRRIGRVPHGALGDLYRSASVVLLPSLLESFSATCVEAMHFGVPLVTSDRDFARDVCGDAALFAEPTDPAALAAAVERALEAGVRERLRTEGFRRVRTFPDWRRRLELYLEACRAAAGPPAGAGRGAAAERAAAEAR